MSRPLHPFLSHTGKPKLRLSPAQTGARQALLKEVQKGNYLYEEFACPQCHELDSTNLLTTDKYGIETHIDECNHCFLVYNRYRLSDTSLFSMYQSIYREIEKPPENTSPLTLFNVEMKKGEVIYNKLSPHIKKGTVIEVGCGCGGVLSYFNKKGFNTIGFDYDETYLTYGRNQGLDLRSIDVKNETFTDNISAIILEQSLEHIVDINDFLGFISRISNKDTLIYIGVPGIRNIHSHYQGNVLEYFAFFHLYHFDSRSLNKMMIKFGFKPIQTDETISGIYSLNGKADSNIEYKQPIKDYLLQSYHEWRKAQFKQKLLRLVTYPFRMFLKIAYLLYKK